jgi:stearoyl-CoA desaturase (delta-9 desaturase)
MAFASSTCEKTADGPELDWRLNDGSDNTGCGPVNSKPLVTLSWILYRVFGMIALVLYIVTFLSIDLKGTIRYASNPWVCAIIVLALFRHWVMGVTIGLHRYYSHAAFKTGRWFEFIIAYSCVASGQGAITWWAGNHRHHHQKCDTHEDPHSPVSHSLAYAWLGWTYDPRHAAPSVRLRYVETRWLDQYGFLVPWLEWALVEYLSNSLALATLTVLLPIWFAGITTLWFNVGAHGNVTDGGGCGAKPYRVFPACVLGEWDHADHHRYPSRAHRPEPDFPYWFVLKPLERFGVVSKVCE